MTLPRMTVETSLPDSLHLALQEDRLVIFVGAGISAAPPTSLPDFRRLTERIARDLDHPELANSDTPTDVSLGRLDSLNGARGQVHERARELLRRKRPRHNQLHRLIAELSLVGTPRIITTNFDTNLERAFKHLRAPVERYIAPALPQGDDFSGIVHLHGQLESRPHEAFVLTDSDFGRAYITRAWASQFLTRVFESYEVLFLGYSGADAVVRYLTTGLPPETDAYAIISDEASSPWEGTRVQLVRYPYDRAFSQLPILLGSWLEIASASASDRVTRLRAVIANGPDQNTVDESYLEWATSTAEMIPFFCEAAAASTWLEWVTGRGLLDHLFSADAVDTEGPQWQWARWVAELVAGKDEQVLLRLIGSHGSRVSSSLWLAIWFKLVNKWDEIGNPGPWVVLLANTCPDHQVERLAILMDKIATTHPEMAIVVLSELMRLRLSLVTGIGFDPQARPRVSTEVRLEVSEHVLATTWGKLSPSLGRGTRWVTDRLISEIERIGSQQSVFAGTAGRWGGPSFYRRTIDGGSTPYPTGAVDVFVDMARDLLRADSEHESIERFDGLLSSANSLVRRLGLDAIAHTSAIGPDQAIAVLIGGNLMSSIDERPEVLAVLDTHLATAGGDVVRDLCAAILLEYSRGPAMFISEAIDLLTWFATKRPSDPEIQSSIAQLRVLDPTHMPNPSRDLLADYSISGGHFAPESEPELSDELAERTPEQLAAEIQSQPTDVWDSRAWFFNLGYSVSLHFDWAMRVASRLAADEIWDSRAWDAIIRGLDTGNQRPDVIAVLKLIEKMPSMNSFTFSLSQLVDHDRSAAEGRSAAEVAEIARALWRCWRASEQVSPPATTGNEVEWSTVTPRGSLARLTIRAIGDAVVGSEKAQTGLSEWHSELSEMVASAEVDADPTLSVLTGDLAWFFYRDSRWTESVLIPNFDWANNDIAARKAWGGFLAYGAWSLEVESALSERFKHGLTHVRARIPSSLDRFLQHHAYLFLNGADSSRDVQWADPFIRDASVELRFKWTEAVAFSLRAQDGVTTKQWQRLSSYWARRNSGLPAPFEGDESFALLQWLELAGVDFSAGTALFLSGPQLPRLAPQMDYRYDVMDLPWETNAADAARVGTRVLKSYSATPWNADALVQRATAVAAGGDVTAAIHFLDELVRLGVPAAQAAIGSIRLAQ